MSRSKKPRKAYRPKYVARNPMTTFFGGMSGDHAEHLRAIQIKTHGALARLARAEGGREEWDQLVGAINMANVMCEQGIGDEFRAVTIAARDALCEVGKRAMQSGKFLFRGNELQALNEAMECHDAQLVNVRAIDVDRAADEVQRRILNRINSTSVRRELEKDMVAAQIAVAQ